MSTNLEYRARERQRKREKRQASETQQEKGRQRSRARDKKEEKKGDIFLLEEQHENFVAAVKKSEQVQLRHFLHKKVSGSFTF